MHFRLFLSVAAVIGMLTVASPARAHLIVITGNLSGDLENILFNDPLLIDDAMTVTGVSKDSGTIFSFTEDTTDLTTPSSGQALVTANDGLFDSLLIAAIDPLLVFNLFEANVNVTGTPMLRITATGAETVVFDFLAGNGENRFGIYTLDNQFISSVLIEALGGESIQDVRQIRVGGIGGMPTEFEEPLVSSPEPAALVLVGSGLFGVCWLARRRRRAI
jgi:hypothetical protein